MKLSELRTLLVSMDFHPSRKLGQNFLVDANILEILLEAAELRHKDSILEIGPGLGVVTERLVDAAKRVVAVEKDKRLYEFLKEKFKADPKLELVCADMLDVNVEDILNSGVTKVVSNLPYSAGSRILINLAMAEKAPETIVVTVQQEVAQRLAAEADDENYSKLGVWLQLDYSVELIKTISPTCFWPVPEVKSEIVRLRRRRWQALSSGERKTLYAITSEAFMHRRKQMATIFNHAAGELHCEPVRMTGLLESLGLDAKSRPENLSVENWCKLAALLTARE